MADVDVLAQLVDVAAGGAQAVQGGTAGGGGEVAVAAAPDDAGVHLYPQLGAQLPGHGLQHPVAGQVLVEGGLFQAALGGDADIGVEGGEVLEEPVILLRQVPGGEAGVDGEPAVPRDGGP